MQRYANIENGVAPTLPDGWPWP
ncbi:hypothetical protein Tco_0507687, partial [Tanacetum coccineum]